MERHAFGRADAYDAALLDVAQDHLLYFLAEPGCFAGDRVVFKGGTSLRKCRLGNDGRFSTDLDFATPDEDVVLETCGLINGARVGGFTFGLEPDRGDGRHWRLRVDHEDLGAPNIAASVEFARRPLALAPQTVGFVPLPVHKSYGFDLPALPVVAEAEACAEKLARYRRIALGRDLYDLNHFAGRPLDEGLVRRLWVLKVWGDVVVDGRGNRPLEPQDVLRERRPQDFQPDSIGVLIRPVDIERWEARVRTRFRSSPTSTTTNGDGRRATRGSVERSTPHSRTFLVDRILEQAPPYSRFAQTLNKQPPAQGLAFRRRQEERRNDIGRRTSAASRCGNRPPIGMGNRRPHRRRSAALNDATGRASRRVPGPDVAGQAPLTISLTATRRVRA